jgi:hypothetical protein
MKESTLDTAVAEAKRFLERAEKLKEASNGTEDFKKFGYDEGFRSHSQSKTRAAVKRACIDLRNALSDVTQGR